MLSIRRRSNSLVHDLQRPECILAERDGTLWSADARGGVVHIRPDGNQEIITQKSATAFTKAARTSLAPLSQKTDNWSLAVRYHSNNSPTARG